MAIMLLSKGINERGKEGFSELEFYKEKQDEKGSACERKKRNKWPPTSTMHRLRVWPGAMPSTYPPGGQVSSTTESPSDGWCFLFIL